MGLNKSKRPELAPDYRTSLQQIRTARVPLTAAQLIAMEAAPVSILAAPGSGYAIIVEQITLEIIAGGSAFTGGGAISFVYHGGSVPPHAGSVPASSLTGAAGTTLTELGPAVATNGTIVPANTGVDITNANAPFAAGNGTAVVLIQYRIVKL